MSNNKNKIAIATRTYNDGYEECVKKLKELFKINSISKDYIISKGYIICDLDDKKLEEENKKEDSKIKVIFDKKPTRATAFNLVIKKLNDELDKDENKGNKYHLLTFSKEVELREENIERMIEEIEKKKELIVVGYRLMDNVLSEEECGQFANGNKNDNYGIAYQVPWNTCALWNKEFVYGENERRLIFDEICEKNQLGHLYVKVNDALIETEFEGMEDGLAIAALVSNNENLKFKLIDERLPWRIEGDYKRIMKHKIKMARKNIVLSAFMNIKGYSIDKLREANDIKRTANSFLQQLKLKYMAQNTIHSKFLVHWTGKNINPDNREMNDSLRKEYIDLLKDDLYKGLCMNPGKETIYGKDNKPITAEIARVCFTEIKLTQTEEHAKQYGRLGIGFNRDFVLEREGNPVFYVQNGEKGHIIENFHVLRNWMGQLPFDTVVSEIKVSEIINVLAMISGYLKNMSCRDENELKYYDEMEWRIVHITRLEGPDNYIQDIGETKEGKKKYRLKVSPKDVRLIVFPDSGTLRLAMKDEKISEYFNSYMPTLIALDDCKNF